MKKLISVQNSNAIQTLFESWTAELQTPRMQLNASLESKANCPTGKALITFAETSEQNKQESIQFLIDSATKTPALKNYILSLLLKITQTHMTTLTKPTDPKSGITYEELWNRLMEKLQKSKN